MSYFERRRALNSQLLPGSTKLERNHNHYVLRSNRQGEYLLQCLITGLYVDYSFDSADDWFALGPRRSAAWFKREELPEILPMAKRACFRLVKLSKNKH